MKINFKKLLENVKESLEGKTFDELAEVFKEWEESGYYNIEIDNMLMNLMEAADEKRFIEFANNY